MPPEWLKQQLTVDEAESAHQVSDERLGPGPVPFGFMNRDWRALLAQMREGDEFWEFCSPPESWEHLAGREGIALVREGKVIGTILTLMN